MPLRKKGLTAYRIDSPYFLHIIPQNEINFNKIQYLLAFRYCIFIKKRVYLLGIVYFIKKWW